MTQGGSVAALLPETAAEAGRAAKEPARGHELVSIQCLRGVAALMVVAFHCFPQLQRMGYAGWEPQFLSAGVDIFFVISGFIMLYSAHRSPERGGGAFLLNRAIRILPLYWLLTTLLVAIALLAPHLLNSTRFVPMHTLFSYLMLPAIHPVTGVYQPILIPGWTLNYEMFFYLLFAIGLWLTRDRERKLALLVGGLILLCLCLPFSGAASFYTGNIIVEFAYGLMMACLFLAGRRIGQPLCILLVLAGMALLIAGDFVKMPDVRALFYGLPALMIFAGTLHMRLNPGSAAVRLLQLAGDASYSIYLSHMMSMAVCGMVWRKVLGGGLPGNTALFMLFSIPVCAVGGWLCYKLVEEPMTEWLRKRPARKPHSA